MILKLIKKILLMMVFTMKCYGIKMSIKRLPEKEKEKSIETIETIEEGGIIFAKGDVEAHDYRTLAKYIVFTKNKFLFFFYNESIFYPLLLQVIMATLRLFINSISKANLKVLPKVIKNLKLFIKILGFCLIFIFLRIFYLNNFTSNDIYGKKHFIKGRDFSKNPFVSMMWNLIFVSGFMAIIYFSNILLLQTEQGYENFLIIWVLESIISFIMFGIVLFKKLNGQNEIKGLIKNFQKNTTFIHGLINNPHLIKNVKILNETKSYLIIQDVNFIRSLNSSPLKSHEKIK
jgi:hypothetical protein